MRALTNAAAAPRYGRLLETAIIAASQAPFVLKSSALNQRIPAAYNGTRWSSSNPGKNDFYSRQAKVKNLKSRAAFKLLEMDSKYKIFKRGQTVVDLGYAPGSWSQVALDRTKPNGRVVGIDIIPAQPPKGVSTIQGDFLSPVVQNMTKEYLIDLAQQGRAPDRDYRDDRDVETLQYREVFVTEKPSYIDTERAESIDSGHEASPDVGKLVDVVLSDMLMNTSGMPFRDHAGSMDLCLAALQFASDTLRTGGHFVCKFYQGAEDKDLELKLKKMFGRVHREKPDSSRSESREAYFVALRRKGDVTFGDVSTS